MNLEFSLRNGHLLYGFPVTHVWRIDMNFDFSARGGRIIVNLDVAKEKIVGSGKFFFLTFLSHSKVLNFY